MPWHIGKLKMDLIFSGGGRWRRLTFTLGLQQSDQEGALYKVLPLQPRFNLSCDTPDSSHCIQQWFSPGAEQQAAQRPIHPGWSGHLSCETSLSKVCDFSVCNYSLASSQLLFSIRTCVLFEKDFSSVICSSGGLNLIRLLYTQANQEIHIKYHLVYLHLKEASVMVIKCMCNSEIIPWLFA